MAGKLQRQSNSKSKEAKPSTENSLAAEECSFLKAKNIDLAKALNQIKCEYVQMTAERDHLQKQLLSATAQLKKKDSYLKVIDEYLKSVFGKIVNCSSDATKAMEAVHLSLKVGVDNHDFNLSVLNTSAYHTEKDTPIDTAKAANIPNISMHKTHAVKPMVSGHVIYRPTINLTRVNEIPRVELVPSVDEIIGRASDLENTLVENDDERLEPELPNENSFLCQSTPSCTNSEFLNHGLSDEERVPDMENAENTNGENEEESDQRLRTLLEVTEECSSSVNNKNERDPQENTLIRVSTGIKVCCVNLSQIIPEVLENRNSKILINYASPDANNKENPGALKHPVRSPKSPLINVQRGSGKSSQNKQNTTSTNFEDESRFYDSHTIIDPRPSTSGINFKRKSYVEQEISKLDDIANNDSSIISGSTQCKDMYNSTLVGPSVILDNLDDTDISKLQQMTLLGLEPKFLREKTSTPFSPFTTRSKKSFRKQAERTPPKNNENQSLATEITPKKKINKKQPKKTSGKIKGASVQNPQVILKRISIKPGSISPAKRNSLKRSVDSSENNSDSARSSKRVKGTTNERNSRKVFTFVNRSTLFISPKKFVDSPIRPRRKPQISLKEPSLRTKLRRSK